jgi:hypothetical protein
MKLNRRTVLGAGAAFAVSGRALAQGGVRIRRGASTLSATSDDVAAFGEGVRLMKRRNDALSWARQNRIHARDAQHNNDRFLPWHRLQLLHLEQIIAGLTGHAAFAMPYWDWQEDRTLPDWITDSASPLYERDRARGVDTLDFAAARWGMSKYVARLADDDFRTFHGPAGSGQGMVEAYGHNHIHKLMGGLMGKARTAAADPFFWLHHANVDRVWATWQAGRPASVYPEDWTASLVTGFVGADGQPTGDRRVGQVLDPRALGYGYDRLYPFPTFSVTEAGPPGATRRIPTGGQVWRLRAEGQGGGRLRLELPADVMARLREADDSLMIEGSGHVGHLAEALLEDRSVEIGLGSSARTITLGSSPTFVHLPEPGGPHAHHGDYRTPFRFGEEVLNLVDDGPLAITVGTEDLAPEDRRPDATAVAIDLTLTLTETRWA